MVRLLLTLLCWMPALAVAQNLGAPLVGSRKVVNNGPGNQSDPHVSGGLVAYTSEASGVSEIRYHDLSSGVDQAIPNGGAYDFVSDVSGSTVVFTRVLATSSIYAYDVQAQSTPVEIAPLQGTHRRGAVIGHRTVAWQDYTYETGTGQPEIAAYDLQGGTLTRLTEDELLDRTPAVSSDGSTIVWTKCPAGAECDVWQAVAGPTGFVSQALTGEQGDESQPDTNGQVVVYASARAENGVVDRDIYWQPVGGGIEHRLALPGQDANPSISGSLLAFERQNPGEATPNYDIMLFDMRTQTLYRLTDTPKNENLNDISVSADGLVHVVWSMPENAFDVHAFTFQLPGNPQCDESQAQPTPEELCAEPGDRPMLASLMLGRDIGRPQEAGSAFQATGEGVLCVDNGQGGGRATAGWVELDGTAVVEPSAFQKDVALVARTVSLEGNTQLNARIASTSGSAFRVRVYGPQPLCGEGFRGTETIPGEQVVPQVWAPGDVDASADGKLFPGCSQGGGMLASLGVLLLASLLWRDRWVTVPARRSRRGTSR